MGLISEGDYTEGSLFPYVNGISQLLLQNGHKDRCHGNLK